MKEFSRKRAQKTRDRRQETRETRETSLLSLVSCLLSLVSCLPQPPPTKCTTSIRSESLTIVSPQSFFRTTWRFNSTAILCDGNEKSSSNRSKLIGFSSCLISPLTVICIPRRFSLKRDDRHNRQPCVIARRSSTSSPSLTARASRAARPELKFGNCKLTCARPFSSVAA